MEETFVPAEASSENLRRIALDEVRAFQEINGKPRLVDVPHLVTRVKALMQPGDGDWHSSVEADVLFAMSQV